MANTILAPVKPCIKCGISDRDIRGNCAACARARTTVWAAANRDRNRASSAAWAAANTSRVKANGEAYRAANIEKRKAEASAWKAANKERSKASYSAWAAANVGALKIKKIAYRIEHKDESRATYAAWAKRNPEARRINYHNYQAKKRANGGVLSKGLSAKLFKLQRGLCPCCKQSLGKDFHLDHIDAISTGGPNIDSNMQLLRKVCNLKKSAQHPIDFMQERGFLL